MNFFLELEPAPSSPLLLHCFASYESCGAPKTRGKEMHGLLFGGMRKELRIHQVGTLRAKLCGAKSVSHHSKQAAQAACLLLSRSLHLTFGGGIPGAAEGP